MNAYLVKFATDYVVLMVSVTANDEDEAERFGLQTLERELGLSLTDYQGEIELEGTYL